MGEPVIPIVNSRHKGLAAPAPLESLPTPGRLRDLRGRPLRDLRISVTDRCNFRCTYCMPKEVFGSSYQYLPHAELLSFEEITRLARLFALLGMHKLRLTGGEPLLRKNVEQLIEQLAGVRTLEGQPLDITLTTNGALLARKAQALKAAGLSRVTVSLDGLDDAVFQRMNDVGFPVGEVLAGIEAARAAGLAPIKVNMVVKRGTNEHEILPMARHFRGTGIALRFIEFMDVGATNRWRMEQVLPSSEVLKLLQASSRWCRWHTRLPARPPSAGAMPAPTAARSEAGRDRPDQQRDARLLRRLQPRAPSTEGQVYLCLFAGQGYDLRALLRGGASDEQITGAIAAIWAGRSDRYSELRASLPPDDQAGGARRVEMSFIGG